MMNWFRLLLTDAAVESTVAEGVQQQKNVFGSLSSMLDTILLVMLFALGVYGIYTVIRLRREMVLFPNKFLYPGNCDPDSCLDPTEFIFFILPRVTALSVGMLVLGILFALNSHLFHLDHIAIDIATIVLPVAVMVWYAIVQNKAAKRFWGQ